MPHNIDRLESLVQLAREPSPEKRRDLLREVTDLFLEAPEQLNDHETEHFADIIGKIAFDLEMEVRRHLAEKLSTIEWAPHSLVKALANDEIEVARPVLTNSGVLRNADLIDIVKRRSQEHLLAVSKRQSVAEEVSDSLVERGNGTVLESLARNQGAELSRKSMEAMVSRSEKNEALHEPLVTRRDLPGDLMNEMFWQVSAALRQHILSTVNDIDENQLDEIIGETETWFDAEQREESLSQAERFVIRKEKMNQLDAALISQLVRQGRVPELVAAFARLIKTDLRMARRIVFDNSGEALAMASKAFEIDQATFSDLLMLLDANEERSRSDHNSLLGVYGRMTTEAAQRAIRFWRTRKQVMSRQQ
ncbi:MAG: DUF2336 domain-containing protein [Rhodospirillales bacterium]